MPPGPGMKGVNVVPGAGSGRGDRVKGVCVRERVPAPGGWLSENARAHQWGVTGRHERIACHWARRTIYDSTYVRVYIYTYGEERAKIK